jgi:hypothetical protein
MSDTDTRAILEALDLSELPAEEQEALLLDLNALVFRGSMVRLVERMDESSRADFEKLVDSDPSEEKLEAFLRARVPDADQAVLETVQEISGDILAATGTNTK